ncbi:MAG TPA: RHS repeat-associated core domain-containing protein, partial [Gammaproteobacteria bacterium]|nr:RHS repeat-associated core domain-containing protein [Gammaproteobacteria bacterium]
VTRARLAGSRLRVDYRYQSNRHDRRLKAILNHTGAFGPPVRSFGYTSDAAGRILSMIQGPAGSLGRLALPGSGQPGEDDDAGQRLLGALHRLLHPQQEGAHGDRQDPQAHNTGTSHAFADNDGDAGMQHRGTGGRDPDRGEGDDRHGGSARVGLPAFLGRRTDHYQYDAADRLTGVTSRRDPDRTYTYDRVDNLLRATGPTSQAFTARYNDVDQITQANGKAYTYDADGHLTDDGTHTYRWDAAGRLIAVTDTGSGKVTRFRYDPLGRRIAIVHDAGSSQPQETDYVWCGSGALPCQARDASGNVVATFEPEGEVRDGQKRYYLRNHLGSVTAVANRRGHVLSRVKYSPYGITHVYNDGLGHHRRAGGVVPAFAYSGMLYDAQNTLYLTLNRAYSSQLHRWLSRDPLGLSAGVNLYAYVHADPTNRVDPLGLRDFRNKCKGRYKMCRSSQIPNGSTLSNWLRWKACKASVDYACKRSIRYCCDVERQGCYARAAGNARKTQRCSKRFAQCIANGKGGK